MAVENFISRAKNQCFKNLQEEKLQQINLQIKFYSKKYKVTALTNHPHNQGLAINVLRRYWRCNLVLTQACANIRPRFKEPFERNLIIITKETSLRKTLIWIYSYRSVSSPNVSHLIFFFTQNKIFYTRKIGCISSGKEQTKANLTLCYYRQALIGV